MTKGTPEGARDFLVPVRLQPGRFFALAQSPQLFKQLTMIGGLDRYYQIATCWRDEDLRADRQFEFRQLDLEMSFVEREDVLEVLERCMVASFEARRPRAAGAAVPAHVVRRGDGEVRHGQAGPPLRPRDPGGDGGHARLRSSASSPARPPSATSSRRRRSRARSSAASRRSRRSGARRGSPTSSPTRPARCARRSRSSSRSRSSPPSRRSRARRRSSPPATESDVARVLGGLRTHLGRELELAQPGTDVVHWVIDFPLFERDEDTGEWTFLHHPFTAPIAGDEDKVESDPGGALSQHYDLIWNGWELGSGSIRIHRADLQEARLPHDGHGRGGAAGEVRVPAGRARSSARRRTAASRPASTAWSR